MDNHIDPKGFQGPTGFWTKEVVEQYNESDPNGKDRKEPGAKLDKGKVRAGLMFTGFRRALMEVAKVSTYGAEKYSPNGWEEVEDGFERYYDAMMRHLLAVDEGDRESEILHLSHAAWNMLAMLELHIRENEDLELFCNKYMVVKEKDE